MYLSNLMLRFDDKSKLKAEEGLGINGALVDITFVKSRTSRAGKVATLVFNQDVGYDNELSLLVMLKDRGDIGGAGAYLYLKGYEDMKFSQKNFKEKLYTDQAFYAAFMDVAFASLSDSIEDFSEENMTNRIDLAADIMSRLRSTDVA